jgi:phosphohistidine phosphatase SixA
MPACRLADDTPTSLMLSRRALLALSLCGHTAAICTKAIADTRLDPVRAIALMQAGGLNLYMRHAITDRMQRDTGRRGDRAGQRNLDERGKAQAAALGQAFRRLNIAVSWVATSEVFRARDTAEIAFGAANVTVVDALIADDYTPRDPMADAMGVRQLLNRAPESGNAMFVGHIIPFGLIMGFSFSQSGFAEGAVALLKPSGERPELIGIINAEAMITAAGLPTPWNR